jgi:hypothetical protein
MAPTMPKSISAMRPPGWMKNRSSCSAIAQRRLAVTARFRGISRSAATRSTPRAAHLDHHLGAVGQGRRADLADRRRGQRRGVEAGENPRDGPAHLGPQDRLDRGGQGRDLILELGELGLVVGRQQVGAGGEDLAELDGGGSQFLERQAQVLGPGVGPRPARVAEQSLVEGDDALQAEYADEIAEPMPGQAVGDPTCGSRADPD